MKRLLPLLLLLTACSVSPVPEQLPDEITPVTNIEQFPSTLSLAYFSTMKLEGKDFTLGDVLSSNSAYTRYTVTYSSNGLQISGILNIPTGDGAFPLMVMNHGYIARSVYTNGRGFKRE
mgnify:FL=1